MPIKTRVSQPESYLASYGRGGPDAALAGRALAEAGVVHQAEARSRYADVEPGISVRESLSKESFEFFRPGDRSPRRKDDMIAVVDNVYRHCGEVKWVIDTMADFVCQGIEVYHPASSKEETYRRWWRMVRGQEVSERLVNLLYRHGTACIKRGWGLVPGGDVRDVEAIAAADVGPEPPPFPLNVDIAYPGDPRSIPNRIPLAYTLLNPTTVDVLGGELALFGQTPTAPMTYGLRIPAGIVRAIKAAKSDQEKAIVARLPGDLLNSIKTGAKIYAIDPERIEVLHYKKDDWQLWGDPLILAVLKDLLLYDKMKDADRAALDGTLSRIRLWTLGLPEHKIQPGPGAFKKLREMILAFGGGGTADVVWDASLKLQESSTDVYKFLGPQKYEPVLRAIYAGLGVPQSMTGGKSDGMTNNALSLKTMMERLQYARNMLVAFWEKEFRIFQRALGHRKPARLRFDVMSLSDEAAEKMLWFHLWDRDLVSNRTIRERFGQLDEVEFNRIRQEYRAREDGRVPAKVGPFTEAAPHPDGLAKAAMLQGTIAPTEAGVKKKAKAKGDKSLLDHQNQQADKQLDLQKEQMDAEQELREQELKVQQKQGDDLHQQKLQQNDDLHQQRIKQKDSEHKAMLPVKVKQAKTRAKGTPGQGRPKGAKDSGQRKTRTPKPRTSATLFALQAAGRRHQATIAELLTPLYLDAVAKRNLRGLTTAQAADLERLKFDLLCTVDPDLGPVPAAVTAALASPPAPIPRARRALDRLVAEVHGETPPVADELREIHVCVYALLNTTGDDDGEADD